MEMSKAGMAKVKLSVAVRPVCHSSPPAATTATAQLMQQTNKQTGEAGWLSAHVQDGDNSSARANVRHTHGWLSFLKSCNQDFKGFFSTFFVG